MRTVRLWLGLVAIASIALTGCSKREDLKLAEIKDRVITIRDYEDAYARVKAEYLPKTTDDKGKRDFLDTMINRDVMAVKADELGYDKDPSVAQGMEVFRRMTEQIAYLRKQVGKIEVSDADIKKTYDLIGASVNFKRILCDREDEAQKAYQALKGGQDFQSVLMQYSRDEDAKDGGTVTSAPYGALLPQVEGPVFDLPVGGYTQPILTPQGWVIIEVQKINKGPKPTRTLEQMKDGIRSQIYNSRQTIALSAFTDQLRDKYGVTWNYDNMEIVFAALPPDKPLEQVPSRDQEVYPLLYFEAGDLDKPLVSYPGRTFTIKDFSDLYDRASGYNRPRREMRLGGIRAFLMQNVMNDISADAVSKSGIENDPDVKKLLDTKRDELMVNLMYEDLVNKKTMIPDDRDRMQAYYNDNKESLRQPEKRNFGVVVCGDENAALKAQEDMLTGKNIATVASQYSTDDATLETKGQTGLIMRGERPDLDQVGFGMTSVGQVSTPFQVASGWMVIKLLEISPERVFTFDEARDTIEGVMRQQDNDKLLNQLLAKWKTDYKVVVHEDNLKKVRLAERQDLEPVKPKAEKGKTSQPKQEGKTKEGTDKS